MWSSAVTVAIRLADAPPTLMPAPADSSRSGGRSAPTPKSQPRPPNWDPDGYVTYDRLQGVYEVDALLIDDIADDSLVLMVMDGARLVEQTGGYFEFERIGHDDLATHLGFQNGDVPQSVNGYPLRTWANYAAAIVDLRTQTSFSIVVERRGSYVTLYYRVV